MAFAERLQTVMDYFGLKQKDIADICGISKASVSYYMKGRWKPKTSTIYALALRFNLNEAWLLGYDMPMFKDSNVSDKQAQAIGLIMGMTDKQLDTLLGIIDAIKNP